MKKDHRAPSCRLLAVIVIGPPLWWELCSYSDSTIIDHLTYLKEKEKFLQKLKKKNRRIKKYFLERTKLESPVAGG